MKSMLTLAAALFAALGLAVCAEAAPIRVASDGAQMQRENPAMPTRVAPENGTKILMHFGDTVIPGVLNDGETARALVRMLPYKVRVSRYSHNAPLQGPRQPLLARLLRNNGRPSAL